MNVNLQLCRATAQWRKKVFLLCCCFVKIVKDYFVASVKFSKIMKDNFWKITFSHCCLTFSWIERQMLRRCCLIHISIFIICVHVQNYVLCLFMSCLCDICFIFIFIFIKINHIISRKQTHLFFRHFLEHFLLFLDDNLNEKRDVFFAWCCS